MENNKVKFYEFKNKTNDSVDLYVYGDIVSGSLKWDDTDVTISDFREQLNSLDNAKTLNMYVSSCGGDVFTTQAMVSNLKRCKDNGVTINAYLDGISASCASWLSLVANNVYAYQNSILMIHKPMTSCCCCNADDMKKQIDTLDTIEDNVIIPIYMDKAKDTLTEDKLKDMLSQETWLGSEDMVNYFDITLLDGEKTISNNVNMDLVNKYKNAPKDILNKLSKQIGEETPPITKEQNIEDKIGDSIDNIDIELLNIQLDLLKK
ncbi:head maturation protease, ClpP-related [Clostridium sp. BL-8]|uniref:head maturation protease, ClpP-related n=1 Tax=Clostridium sp. BL-8 TaxID=349938 RepID=UPI00098C8FC1|nr:head maturation protease, ClpP-related [Clostridium sp. BL-8]OOM76582.1 ATP-dependent Clp protease proteolytic subunit [Clostridium sp. BL-8]